MRLTQLLHSSSTILAQFILVIKRTKIPTKLTEVQGFRKKTTTQQLLFLGHLKILLEALGYSKDQGSWFLPCSTCHLVLFSLIVSKQNKANKDCRQISIPDNTKEEEGIKLINWLLSKLGRYETHQFCSDSKLRHT